MFQIKIQTDRIKKEDQDPALYYYHIRGSDYDFGRPTSLEKFVGVNYYGTVISTVSLDALFAKKNYFSLRGKAGLIGEHENTGNFFDGSLLFPQIKQKDGE